MTECAARVGGKHGSELRFRTGLRPRSGDTRFGSVIPCQALLRIGFQHPDKLIDFYKTGEWHQR